HPWLSVLGFSASESVLKGYAPSICESAVSVSAALSASDCPRLAALGNASGFIPEVREASNDSGPGELPTTPGGGMILIMPPRAEYASTSTPPALASLRT